MVEWLMKEWISKNQFVKENPIGYILLFAIAVLVYKGIPCLIKWKKGVNAREKYERDTTRKKVIETSDVVLGMKTTLDTHNGNLVSLTKEFQIHETDDSIHTGAEKLDRIHERIDGLYEKIG